MCYYNGQRVTKAEHIRLKQLEKLVSKYDFLKSDVHIGPEYGPNAVLKPIPGKEDFDLVQMEWGFIPDKWFGIEIDEREKVDRFRKGFPNLQGKNERGVITLNAVGEELLLPHKIYRESALKRRCLIISSGFYEWRHIFPIGKRKDKPLKVAVKYPYFISIPGREYFFMAGVWKPWTDKKTGEHVQTDAIITTNANSLLEQVHNSKKRMPTILDEDLAWEWLFGNLDEKQITEIATTQFPAAKMSAYPIAKDFISALHPTEPFEYADLPELNL